MNGFSADEREADFLQNGMFCGFGPEGHDDLNRGSSYVTGPGRAMTKGVLCRSTQNAGKKTGVTGSQL